MSPLCTYGDVEAQEIVPKAGLWRRLDRTRPPDFQPDSGPHGV